MEPFLPAPEIGEQGKAAQATFSEFIRQSWHVLEPTVDLDWNWHIDAIADHAQATLGDWIERQKTKTFDLRIQNLLINVPPGTAKSRIVSVCMPAWVWTLWPSWRAIFLSSNPRVALRDSLYCRDVIKSEWYKDTFQPRWDLHPDQDAKGLFRNTAGGWRMAIGFNSRITGDRADALIVDDPHDAEEVQSDLVRQNVLDRWDSAIANRLNDLRSSVRIGIMQRLHESDWSGHVLKKGGWEHLCIPMEYEPERYEPGAKAPIPKVTAIGWSDPRTEPGELMFPARFPSEVIETEKNRLMSKAAGQLQQRPAPAGGNLFKDSWFANRYRALPKFREVYSCWDTALKDKEVSDETACVTGGLGEDGDLYVLHALHGHWKTPEVETLLVRHSESFRAMYPSLYSGDYIEDKVSGTTLMQFVRRNHPDVTVIPIAVGMEGKVVRAHGIMPMCEGGQVRFPDEAIFPDSARWVEDLLEQLKVFPNSKRDDLVDAFVYFCRRVFDKKVLEFF